MNQLNEDLQKITATQEASNIIGFSNGVRIEYYNGRLVIHRSDSKATLELVVRLSDNGSHSIYSIAYWKRDSSWSDGQLLSDQEEKEIQFCIKKGAYIFRDDLRQQYYDYSYMRFIDVPD